MLNNKSLTSQLIIYLMITSFSVVFIGISINIWYRITYEKETFIRQNSLESKLVASLVAVPLAFYDEKEVRNNLNYFKNKRDIISAVVYSLDKNLVVYLNEDKEYSFKEGQVDEVLIENSSLMPWNFGILKIRVAIKEDVEVLGYLETEIGTSILREYFFDFLTKSLISLIVLMVIVYFISISLSRKILKPILSLARVAKDIAQTKDYSVRVSHNAKNEITTLYNAFNILLKDTESLTNNLESRVDSRTKELVDSLETIKLTQAQLVESEKMAALGSLVSGLAHEVNTPLGNALTGGSIISRESKKLLYLVTTDSLKKSTLVEGLEILDKSAKSLHVSLTRAADLIRSFKRISIDQNIEEQQKFNLYEYIDNIVTTFSTKLRRKHIDVEIYGDKELSIKSFPGTYAQIFTNLIQNSILHGFSKNKIDAKISIYFKVTDNFLMLSYEDNGEGMDENIRSVAFEPFTTTKRNAGGTGLGLNILYNLVSQKLGGTIVLSSKIGDGVHYEIKLPLNLK